MKQTLSYCRYYYIYHWYLGDDYLTEVDGWMNPTLLQCLGYTVESLPEYPDHDPDAYKFFDQSGPNNRFNPPKSRMVLLQQFTDFKKYKQQLRLKELMRELKDLQQGEEVLA